MTARVRPADACGSDFVPLLRMVRERGLLRPRRGHYAGVIAGDLLGYAAVWVAVCMLGATWWALPAAVPAALFSARIIFIGHDVAHRQVARTKQVSGALSLFVGDLVTGLSARWWTDKHSRHHANPNIVGRDPDVAPGALIWTPEQARARRHRFGIWAARHQARLYFPMLLLEALNLRRGSFQALRTRRALFLPVCHLVVYLGGLALVMSPGRAAVFVCAHQSLLGLHLGCAFAPNHKGMPMFLASARPDFLRKQVLSTRNVRGGPVTDWLLGGLNYQIEHHLFPSMPRPNLRRARLLVRRYCADVGVCYTEETFARSMLLTLRHLNEAGRGTPPDLTRAQ